MSPINFNLFRSVPTNIKLNGPYLRVVSPLTGGKQDSNGFVTFQVSVEAFYVNGGGNADGGYTFKWYVGGIEQKDSQDNPNSNARIVNVGGTSTLTLTNVPPSLNGAQVFVEADYVSSKGEGIAI